MKNKNFRLQSKTTTELQYPDLEQSYTEWNGFKHHVSERSNRLPYYETSQISFKQWRTLAVCRIT